MLYIIIPAVFSIIFGFMAWFFIVMANMHMEFLFKISAIFGYLVSIISFVFSFFLSFTEIKSFFIRRKR